MRELDERLGFSELIEQHLTDPRGKNTQLPLADLLRQSLYSRLAGYEDVNDAERLAQDPTLRLIGSEKIWERGAALTSRLQSFETEVLARGEKQTKPASETAKRAAMRLEGGFVDLINLTREGSRRMVSRRDGVKFGISG